MTVFIELYIFSASYLACLVFCVCVCVFGIYVFALFFYIYSRFIGLFIILNLDITFFLFFIWNLFFFIYSYSARPCLTLYISFSLFHILYETYINSYNPFHMRISANIFLYHLPYLFFIFLSPLHPLPANPTQLT